MWRFNTLKPADGEKLSCFVKRLKQAGRAAGIKDTDTRLLMQVAINYPSESVRNKCMEEKSTLAQVVAWQINNELNEKNGRVETGTEINRIKTSDEVNAMRTQVRPTAYNSRNRRNGSDRNDNRVSHYSSCSKCGDRHKYGECPAFGKRCHNCQMSNHYAKVCRRPPTEQLQPRTNQRGNNQRVNRVNQPEENTVDEMEHYYICRIKSVDSGCPHIEIDVCGTKVLHMIDTGASTNILSAKSYAKLMNKPNITPVTRPLFSFNSNVPIPTLGQFTTAISINAISTEVTYVVVENEHEVDNLLGYKSLRDFGIIKIINSVKNFNEKIRAQYSEIFEERIGKLAGVQVSIETDPLVRSSQQPHYKVPFHMIPGTKQKLEELIQQGVIEPVPPEAKVTWISPMHPVEKASYEKPTIKPKGVSAQQRQAASQRSNIRITNDNKKLNKAIILAWHH